jgi:hypothetical protein
MRETIEDIITDFISKEFKIKRIRNEKRKWSSAIIIPKGYIRQTKKYYKTSNTLNHAMVSADIIAAITNVFNIDTDLAKKLTERHLSNFKF